VVVARSRTRSIGRRAATAMESFSWLLGEEHALGATARPALRAADSMER
jgi:hypothetical protein